MTLELFHVLADADCAAARRAVAQHGLLDAVHFRNLFFEGPKRDFAARGGTRVPALWDGERLHEGLPAVVAALAAR